MGNSVACQGPCFVAFGHSPAKARTAQHERANTACMTNQERDCGTSASEAPTAAITGDVPSAAGELMRVLALRRAKTTHENDPSTVACAAEHLGISKEDQNVTNKVGATVHLEEIADVLEDGRTSSASDVAVCGIENMQSERGQSADDGSAFSEQHHCARALANMRSALIIEDNEHHNRIHSRSALVVDDGNMHLNLDGMDSDLQHSAQGGGSVSDPHCMRPLPNMRSALLLESGENCSRQNMRSAMVNERKVLGGVDGEQTARKNMRSAMVDHSNLFTELEDNDSNEKDEVQLTPKRRFDFGVGISRCRHCKPVPRLNRGCELCGARLCRSCFQEHTCDTFAQLPDSVLVHDRRGHRASGAAADVAAQALSNII